MARAARLAPLSLLLFSFSYASVGVAIPALRNEPVDPYGVSKAVEFAVLGSFIWLFPGRRPSSPFLQRLRTAPAVYMIFGAVVLLLNRLLDLVSGGYLDFPILFVLPVILAAWYCKPAWSIALAVLLPLGWLLIAALGDSLAPQHYSLTNVEVQVLVLFCILSLVFRVTRHTTELTENAGPAVDPRV